MQVCEIVVILFGQEKNFPRGKFTGSHTFPVRKSLSGKGVKDITVNTENLLWPLRKFPSITSKIF